MKYIAKNSGETIFEHSNKVKDLALLLYSEYSKYNSKREFDVEILKIASLLHDVGKAMGSFQKFLIENGDDIYTIDGDEDKFENIKYLHNQYGASVIRFFLNKKLDELTLDYIVNIIYWHHGVKSSTKKNKGKDDCKLNDIYKSLSDIDLTHIKNCIIHLIGGEDYEYGLKDVNEPTYFSLDTDYNDFWVKDDADAKLIYLRSIVVLSDRLISEYDKLTPDEVFLIYKDYLTINNNILMEIPEYYNNKRFKEQNEIVDKCINTTVVKAPAGYGKSLLGFLWIVKNKKKTIWVCPRNTVAKSVYRSLIDLNIQFKSNIRIQLFLTGEIINSNDNSDDADIIVTNIDNYLKNSIDNSKLNQNHLINVANLVFDEYHELIDNNPIYYLFNQTMIIRHKLVNTNTLLLSATPNILHKKWNVTNNMVNVLPDDETHYSAVHNKPYNIVDKIETSENHLKIFNSINLAQTTYILNLHKNPLLLHSQYTPNDRKRIMSTLYDYYGKDVKKSYKPFTVSAPLIQASFDVSYNKLSESVSTPDNTLQRIGRCNRWGEYDDSMIEFFTTSDRGEVTSITYNKLLSEKWINILDSIKGEKVTLNEFYLLYNTFFIENENEIERYNNSVLENSRLESKNIRVIKYFNRRNKIDKIYTANSNVLRNDGSNSIFYIVRERDYITGEIGDWIGTFNKSNFDTHKDYFKLYTTNIKQRIDVMRSLIDDDRFGYEPIHNKHEKNMTIKSLVDLARKSNKPLVVFNYFYDKKIGIYSDENL